MTTSCILFLYSQKQIVTSLQEIFTSIHWTMFYRLRLANFNSFFIKQNIFYNWNFSHIPRNRDINFMSLKCLLKRNYIYSFSFYSSHMPLSKIKLAHARCGLRTCSIFYLHINISLIVKYVADFFMYIKLRFTK